MLLWREDEMENGRASATAQAAAALRAAHLFYDKPCVFEDPYAIELTSDEYRELHKEAKLKAFFDDFGLTAIRGQIVGRARYAEDALEAAVTAGVRQYVMLGAGLDSFIMRRPDLMQRLTVFELDHPDTQAYKLERLNSMQFEYPDNVVFVPVDFEATTLDTALSQTIFEPAQPAFFAWLGVVAYLTREAIFSSLAAIRTCSAAGGELLFDYPILEHLIDPSERALTGRIKQGTAQMGEARPAQHDPRVLIGEVCELGFELVEDLSPAQHRERFFSGRDDDLRPYPEVHIAHFRAL
jgi:methyltransferase (TIGR00027 family)